MKADLHIHTCLSPCGDLDMSPGSIIETAEKKGLDLLAICDHNTGENVLAVQNAAKNRNAKVRIIAGMEIATKEEAHILAYFNTVDDLLHFQSIVYNHLIPGINDEKLYGMQVVANAEDEVESLNNKLLIYATTLPVYRVIEEIHKLNGLAIAAHINKESFSIISQLGFIPEDMTFDALEVSPKLKLENVLDEFPMYSKYSFITSSDSHYLEDIGKVTTSILMEEASFKELKLAINNLDGRRILYKNEHL